MATRTYIKYKGKQLVSYSPVVMTPFSPHPYKLVFPVLAMVRAGVDNIFHGKVPRVIQQTLGPVLVP